MCTICCWIQHSNYKASKKGLGLVKRSISERFPPCIDMDEYASWWHGFHHRKAVQMPGEKCWRAPFFYSVISQCELSSNMTLEFHITSQILWCPAFFSVFQWKKCLRREQSIYFPLLLTESVPMALHTLAGTRLLHHPSIASLVQQPPHQNPNQLTGWHLNFSTDNADDVVAMVD